MTVRARLIAFAVGSAAAVATALASPTTAHASGPIGGAGAEPRCYNHPTAVLCLYFRYWETAYWGHGPDADNQDDDLGDNRFFSGTGTGAGEVVRNNARKMMCYISASECRSYVHTYQTGPYDWTFGGWRGELNETWNDEASTWILF